VDIPKVEFAEFLGVQMPGEPIKPIPCWLMTVASVISRPAEAR
jgi:hypothetical protein